MSSHNQITGYLMYIRKSSTPAVTAATSAIPAGAIHPSHPCREAAGAFSALCSRITTPLVALLATCCLTACATEGYPFAAANVALANGSGKGLQLQSQQAQQPLTLPAAQAPQPTAPQPALVITPEKAKPAESSGLAITPVDTPLDIKPIIVTWDITENKTLRNTLIAWCKVAGCHVDWQLPKDSDYLFENSANYGGTFSKAVYDLALNLHPVFPFKPTYYTGNHILLISPDRSQP